MANTSSALFCPLTKEELLKITKESVGEPLTDAVLQDGGLFNTTYRLTVASGKRYILRVGPVHPELLMYHEHRLMAAEREVFTLMENAAIPCSHVVAVGKTGNRDYMLVDFIDALPLSSVNLSPDERKTVTDEIVVAMSRLHQIKGDRFGRVSETLFGRGFSDCFSFLLHEIECVLAQGMLSGAFTADESDRILDAVTACRFALNEVTLPVLCHGDLWDGNILVKKEDDGYHLAAVIDVDRAAYCDVDFDLGNPWMPMNDLYLTPADGKSRTLRRQVYAMNYFVLSAQVWRSQYCNDDISQSEKRNALQRADEIFCIL